MYRILTLTDFSENSKSALEFSKTVAKNSKSEIYILHALAPTIGTITLNDQSVELNNIRFENSKERLDKIVNEFSSLNLSANAIIGKGDLSSILKQVISENNIDLLIFSSKGYKIHQGKNIAFMIANIYTPILMIPSDYVSYSIKNACFVHQLEKPKLNHLRDAFKLLETFNVHEINLLHIQSNEQDVFHADKSIEQTIKQTFPDQTIHFTFLEGEFVVDSIFNFLKKVHTDFLIVSSNRKTFWKRFVAGNIHLNIGFKLEIPVLILTDQPV